MLLALLGIPLGLGLIKPNPWYGFRIKATRENPDLWYPVNEMFGHLQFIVGFATFLSSYLLYRVPGLTVETYALDVLGIFLMFCIPAIYMTYRFLKRLKKKR